MYAKLRRLALLAVARVLHYCGALWLWRFLRWRLGGKRHACVLGLHRVLTDSHVQRSNTQYGIVLREKTFIRLLEYLARHFQVVALDEFLKACASPPDYAKPLCLITFDDGWKDNYTVAFPVLDRLKLPATIFLVTGLVENQGSFWIENLRSVWNDPAGRERILSDREISRAQATEFDPLVEYLKRMPRERREQILAKLIPAQAAAAPANGIDHLMNWGEVREMSQRGVEFGTHTVNHPLLTHETDMTVEYELHLSKLAVESHVGREVRSFCYPNGDWDQRVRQWVERTGYQCAFTTRLGWHRLGDDPFTIRRIMIHERNVTGLDGEFFPPLCSFTLAREL